VGGGGGGEEECSRSGGLALGWDARVVRKSNGLKRGLYCGSRRERLEGG